MESLPVLVTDMALILIVAGVMTLICKLLKQPLIIGYVVAGFLLSPLAGFFPIDVVNTGEIETLAEIGVIFLMFGLGLEFNIAKMKEVGISGIVSATVQIVGMVAVGYLIGTLMGWTAMDSLFLGGMLSMSSTIITVKAIEDCNLLNRPFSRLAIGTLVIEDIAAIFLMLVLSTVAAGSGGNGDMLFTICKLIFYLALWLVLGIFLLPSAFRRAKKLLSGESLLIVSLGICFLMVLIADAVGFSTALGAFMAGTLLAGTAAAEEIEHLINPCKDLFVAVFFVSVGFLVVPSTLLQYIVPIIILIVVTLIAKIILLSLSYLLTGQNIETSLHCAFSQTQVGEFSFVIASLGLSLGVTGDFLYPVIVAVALLTTFTTPFLLRAASPCSKLLVKVLPDKIVSKIQNNENRVKKKQKRQVELWNRYLKRCIIQLTIYSLVCVGIIVIGYNVILPKAMELLPYSWTKLLLVVVLFLVVLPFIPQLIQPHDPDFTALWMDGKKHRLALAAIFGIRTALAVGLLMLAPIVFYHNLPYWLLIAIIPLAVIVTKSPRVRGSYLAIAARFMANLNEKQLREEKQKGTMLWESKDYIVDRYRIPADSILVGQRLDKLKWGRVLHLNVIRIESGRKINNLPHGNVVICGNDIISIYGSLSDMENFRMVFDDCDAERMNDNNVTFYDYIMGQDDIPEKYQLFCYGVCIHKDAPFSRKSVMDTGLKNERGCFIVGVDRGMLPIRKITADFILLPGDVLWILCSLDTIIDLMDEESVSLADTNMKDNTGVPV